MWAPRGTRPRVIRQQQFENAYIFGAVCPETGQSEGFISPYANHHAMEVHLEQISKNAGKGRHVVLILDRAGWHTTKRLKSFANISLLPLPSASPELNPVEQVWHWVRENHLANRCFSDYEDIVDACSMAWNSFAKNIEVVKSLCSRKWAQT